MCSARGDQVHPGRVSPFGNPRIKAWSTAPRGLSQPPTSFIGIWRQGIRRWLFVAWNVSFELLPTLKLHFKVLDARAHYGVLKERRIRGQLTAAVGE